MKNRKGFTLIELLVVIAIIGILAAIVLVSLREAPDKAKNVRIESAMNQVRTKTEMFYIDNSTYVGVCDTADNTLVATSSFITLEDDIKDQQGGTDVELNCQASASSYCISAELVGGAGWFCIDDEGHATIASSDPCSDADDTCQ